MKRRNRACKSSIYLQKSPAEMVTEALMAELRCQLNRAHQMHLQQLDAEKRQTQSVDYSWLVSDQSPVRRPYEIPEMKRIELEQMCARVQPSECGRVLLAFRQQLADREANQSSFKADEIPHVFRATVLQVLSLRPATNDRPVNDIRLMSQRLTKSLTNVRLRPGSRASVAPLVIHDEDAASASTSSSLVTISSGGPSSHRQPEIT